MPRAAKTANGLTMKQNRFVEEYLRTGNATEAYRRAYDAKGMKVATINRKATLLLNEPAIAVLVERRCEKIRERTEVTLEGLTEKLEAVYEAALAGGQFSAAVAAQKAIGEFHGFKVGDRQNARDPFEGKTREELVAIAGQARAELEALGVKVH